MIKEFVEAFDSRKGELRLKWQNEHPSGYADIVQAVVEFLSDGPDSYGRPDPARIHQIDDGDYQGTLVFVIGCGGYQPSDYWSVMVSYGSCSGCDTLDGIRHYSDDPPSEEQVDDYMTLALHVVQGLRSMSEALS